MEITVDLLKKRIEELEQAVDTRRTSLEQAVGALTECRAILAYAESTIEVQPVEAQNKLPFEAKE